MTSRTGAREQDALPAQTETQPMSDVPMSSPWLTVTSAAGYATLSRDTIYTACERGELRHVRVAGCRHLESPNPVLMSQVFLPPSRCLQPANTAASEAELLAHASTV